MRGNANLDSVLAIIISERVQLIPDGPRARAAIEHIAAILVEMCHGAIIGNKVATPADQARFTINTAVDTWDKWYGVPALRRIFNSEYAAEIEENRYRCKLCEDSGAVLCQGRYRACSCHTGKLVGPTQAAEMNQLLDLHAEGEHLKAPAEPMPNTEAVRKVLDHPITQADVEREIAERKRPEKKDTDQPDEADGGEVLNGKKESDN